MPEAAPTVFVVGEALVDIVVDGADHREHPGGSPMNVAYGLARLGLATRLRTSIGRDERAAALEAHLASVGVALDPASITDARTSTAVATIQVDRHAEYEFDIAWDPGAIEAPQETRLIHTGSIASVLAPGADDVLRLFDAARARALLSFDPNVRPGVTPDRTAALARVDSLAALAHVVKMSDEDAAWLHPDLDLDGVLDRYLAAGATLVAITRGGSGCLIASAADRLRLPSLPVDVVDTIGAGDAFMSGMLYAILSSGIDLTLRQGSVAASDLRFVAEVALRSARVTVSRAGATPPTLAELSA
ncbi:MAG: hypothetical protein JWP75_2607 [Frondihabitans sp.]|nr:hypothetical protein [Frondihabitans sp.]